MSRVLQPLHVLLNNERAVDEGLAITDCDKRPELLQCRKGVTKAFGIKVRFQQAYCFRYFERRRLVRALVELSPRIWNATCNSGAAGKGRVATSDVVAGGKYCLLRHSLLLKRIEHKLGRRSMGCLYRL